MQSCGVIVITKLDKKLAYEGVDWVYGILVCLLTLSFIE